MIEEGGRKNGKNIPDGQDSKGSSVGKEAVEKSELVAGMAVKRGSVQICQVLWGRKGRG